MTESALAKQTRPPGSLALHDETWQILAALYLRIDEIAAEVPLPQRERVYELRTLVDQVDDQIRRIAHGRSA